MAQRKIQLIIPFTYDDANGMTPDDVAKVFNDNVLDHMSETDQLRDIDDWECEDATAQEVP